MEPDLSGNRTGLPGHEAACPGANNGYWADGLRVVSDATLEPDVEIIADRLVNSSVSRDTVVVPVMTGRPGQVHAQHCHNKRGEENWRRQCPEGSRNEHMWWTCDVRQFVAKVHCGYLDADGVIPCMAYDRTRTFPVHGNHPGPHYQPLRKGGEIVTLDKVAHNLAVYPMATAHYFNQFPRLVYLAMTLPSDVPILLANHRLRNEIIAFMAKRGWIDPGRIINWDVSKIYYAKSLYFAGELGLSEATGNKWDSLREEKCSWAMALPRTLVQKLFTQDYVQASAQPVVIVVHRIDASTRKVDNNDALVAALERTFPNCTVRVFIGRDHDIEGTVKWFGEADVLLAPHGAALGFMPFLRPGRAVIEFGYTGGGMSFPGSF